MRNSALVVALLAAATLAGCGAPIKERFFTLSSGATPEGTGTAAAYSVAVGSVSVPELVDRPQLVVRISANEVMIAEQSRWAEPLKSEIPRVIAGNLAQLLNARVSAYPQNTGGDADYRVTVDVQRFDSTLGDAATIEALWTVRPAKGAPKSGRTLVREATGGAGYDALVVSHGRALATVSRDIADAIRSMSSAAR